MEDTIAAIATAPGEAGIAVVRMSGTQALHIAERIFRSRSGRKVREMATYTATYGVVVDARTEDILDDGILLFMRGPNSYTGEDVVELSVHGGLQAPKNVLAACCDAGARLAEPGEFTRRAFINGKLDLTQVGAIADLIQARSETALRISARQRAGSFGDRLRNILEGIDELRFAYEAAFDFPDDVQMPASSTAEEKLAHLLRELTAVKRAAANGSRIYEGFRVVLTGPPNVGKSTLFNRLLGQERALVSEWAGTTRDTLDAQLIEDGATLQLVDTAGLRTSEDPVERMGVERAEQMRQSADLRLEVREASTWLHAESKEHDRNLSAIDNGWLVLNKVDMLTEDEKKLCEQCTAIFENGTDAPRIHFVSAKTGEGMELLRRQLIDTSKKFYSDLSEEAFHAGERQLEKLRHAFQLLTAAQGDLHAGQEVELIASALAGARQALAEALGERPDPELLDEMFERFCIGK